MRRVWLALSIASLGWGTAGVLTRVVLNEGVEPYASAALRSSLAAVVVLIFLFARRVQINRRPRIRFLPAGRRKPDHPRDLLTRTRSRGVPRSPEAWKVGLVMGVSNLAVPYVLSTIALQYASAGFIGLTTALIPLFTALLAHFALENERLSPMKVGGLVLGFAGVGALLGSGESGLVSGGRPLVAGVLALISVASIAAGGVYAKHHSGAYEPLDVTGVHFVSGSIVIVIATLIAEGLPPAPSGLAWALLVTMAIFTTFVPFALYYWMLRSVSATFTSIAGYLVPPIAVIAGIVFLDERLQSGIVLGGLLIFAGVLVTDRSERMIRPRR